MAVSSIISDVQQMLDDPGGKAYTVSYLLPFVDRAYRRLSQEMSALDLSYDDRTVILSNVPAETADLSTYQATGAALETMVQPRSVEFRMVGEDDTMFRPVTKTDKIKDAPASEQGILSWSWANSTINLSKSSVPVDIRVLFDATPAVLDEVTDTVEKGVELAVAYLAAAEVAGIRGLQSGTGEPLGRYFERQAMTVKDNVEVQMVKQEQVTIRKFGRNTVKGNRRYRWMPPTV